MKNKDYSLVTSHAEVVDQMYFYGKQKSRYLREIDFIDKIMALNGLEKNVIDAGCGTGIHLMLLNEKGYSCCGFDLRKEMVAVANKRNPSLKIVQADMKKFPNLGISNAIICMYGAINYLETKRDLKTTLANFYNHLKKGGVAIVDTRCYKNLDENVSIWHNDKFTLAKRWVKLGGNPVRSAYRIFYSMPSKGIMEMEDHIQFFQDPFLIKDFLVDEGFSKIDIYNNYNLEEIFSEDTSSYLPVIVAKK